MGFELRETFRDHPLLAGWKSIYPDVANLRRLLSIGLGMGALLVGMRPVEACAAQAPRRHSARGNVLEHTLENGWRFVLYPRPGAPTLSFETYALVGSADDPEGMSGMANLVKNLLFKGSSRIGTTDWALEKEALAKVQRTHAEWLAAEERGANQESSAAKLLFDSALEEASRFVASEEFSRTLEAAGGTGTLNAYVDQDSTRFVVSLPSNQVELWCWMESERFLDPVFREFFVERAALLEEWGTRAVGDPTGALSKSLRLAAFGEHPSGRASMGEGDEIARLQPAAAEQFYLSHYGARQMITSIVGNMDPESLIPMLERYFGRIGSGPSVPNDLPPIEPQGEERRVLVASDGEPEVWIAWHVPPYAHPDSAAIEIAFRLLGYARSSRLEKRLTRGSALASSLELNPAWEGNRRASLALIRCAPNLGVPTDKLERAIYDEIRLLVEEGPTPEELSGVKRVIMADHYRSLRDNRALAAGLSSSFAKAGSWQHYFEREERLGAVQGREVQRVVRRWFTAENRSVAILGTPGESQE